MKGRVEVTKVGVDIYNSSSGIRVVLFLREEVEGKDIVKSQRFIMAPPPWNITSTSNLFTLQQISVKILFSKYADLASIVG